MFAMPIFHIVSSLQFATIIGVFCVLTSQVRYIKKIYDGNVVLSLSGMTVFTISSLVGGAGTVASGGLYEGIVPLSLTVLDLVMLFVAITKHHHSGWNRNDYIYLSIALLCVIGWIIFNSPAVGVLCCLGFSLIGYISIFKKMLNIPGQEDNLSWLFIWLAFVFPFQALVLKPGFRFQWSIHSIIIFNIFASFIILFANFVQQYSRFDSAIVSNRQ
jgi:hypothetical protein